MRRLFQAIYFWLHDWSSALPKIFHMWNCGRIQWKTILFKLHSSKDYFLSWDTVRNFWPFPNTPWKPFPFTSYDSLSLASLCVFPVQAMIWTKYPAKAHCLICSKRLTWLYCYLWRMCFSVNLSMTEFLPIHGLVTRSIFCPSNSAAAAAAGNKLITFASNSSGLRNQTRAWSCQCCNDRCRAKKWNRPPCFFFPSSGSSMQVVLILWTRGAA